VRTLVEHDWSAYNRFVDRQASKVGLDTPVPRPLIDWWTRGRAIALVIAAAGVAIALVLWAWRSAGTDLRSEGQQLGNIAEAAPQSGAVPNWFPAVPQNSVVDPTPSEGETIRNYVIFTRRTLSGVGIVETGWQFADNNAARPDLQWCYLRPDTLRRNGISIVIDFPRVGLPQIPVTVLSSYELNRDQVARANALCVWFEKQI
jgi:hypothetical protein